MDDKWFGTPEYRIAGAALDSIVSDLENPTYAQVVQVLECMRDLAKEIQNIRTTLNSIVQKLDGLGADAITEKLAAGFSSQLEGAHIPE